MQIHGCDLTIPTRFNPDDTLAHAVNAIRRIWGSVVIEIDSPPVIFVYRSKEAADAWDAHGWNEKYAKDMVHLLIDLDTPQELGVVLEDDKDPVLMQIIESVTEALKP
jgi:hypothetical protein